jgi:phenylacetate-CoA ligase
MVVSNAHRLAVHVEAGAALAPEHREAVVTALKGAIRDATGVDADIQLGDPGSLPRSQGRAVRVRDLRPRSEQLLS